MEHLDTQDSLRIIRTVIEQRRQTYEENGIFLLLWGALIVIAGLGQYVMVHMGRGEHSGWMWILTMVPGFVVTFVSKFVSEYKKGRAKKGTDLLGWLWAMAGGLALATGFFFGGRFGVAFTAMIYLPFCVVAMASALSLKNYMWVGLSLLATAIAYGSIFMAWQYHSLISALIALLLFLIPGVQLFVHHKKRAHV